MNDSTNVSAKLSSTPVTSAVIWCSVFGLTGLLIVVLNVATLVTFAVNRHLRRHGVYSLLNLATADMLLGIVMMPYYIIDVASAVTSKDLVPPHVLTTLRAFYITTVIASLFCLVLVSLQRLYATYYPFGYRANEAKMLGCMFAVPWFLAVATALVFFLLDNLQDQVVIFIQVLFALSLGVIIICYIAIFIKVKMRYNRQRDIEARESHLAGTVFMVTALSLITWVPSIVFHSIYKTQTVGFSFDLQLSIYWILCTNSLINPIVYLLRMKDFRLALFNLVTHCSPVGTSVLSPVHFKCLNSRRTSEVRFTSICSKDI